MNASLMLTPWGQKLIKSLMKSRSKYKSRFETNRWSIVKGDKVEVTQGPQTGQRGVVSAVIRKTNRIVIEGVNMRRRIVKPTADGMPGKIVTKACSLHYSNVMLLDPSLNKPTKVYRRYLEDGTKTRVSKKSGALIPKPDPLANKPPRSTVVGIKDTPVNDVFETTFDEYEKYASRIYQDFKKSSK